MSTKDTDRKRRRDSWDQALSETQQYQVLDRMRRFAWFEVAKWIAEEFKIKEPSRAGLYRFVEYAREHESEYLLRQRILDQAALKRELDAVGSVKSEQLVSALANDVAAARAKGDDQAVARAVRSYQVAASIVGDTLKLQLATKAEHRAGEELKLTREKWEVEVCEKFLSWFQDSKAREIAESQCSNSEKIAALRQAYYADVDALEKSGQVHLPS